MRAAKWADVFAMVMVIWATFVVFFVLIKDPFYTEVHLSYILCVIWGFICGYLFRKARK